jgi:hypothetical protein
MTTGICKLWKIYLMIKGYNPAALSPFLYMKGGLASSTAIFMGSLPNMGEIEREKNKMNNAAVFSTRGHRPYECSKMPLNGVDIEIPTSFI